MIHIDHISISAANIYEASHRLRAETRARVPSVTAGFFSRGQRQSSSFRWEEQPTLEVGGFV